MEEWKEIRFAAFKQLVNSSVQTSEGSQQVDGLF